MTEEPKDPAEKTVYEFAGELAEQINKITSNRGSIYGPPEENFTNTANFWNSYLIGRFGSEAAAKCRFTAADVGHLLSLVKTARLCKSPSHPDSILDAAVYTLLGGCCAIQYDVRMAKAVTQYFEEQIAKAQKDSPPADPVTVDPPAPPSPPSTAESIIAEANKPENLVFPGAGTAERRRPNGDRTIPEDDEYWKAK